MVFTHSFGSLFKRCCYFFKDLVFGKSILQWKRSKRSDLADLQDFEHNKRECGVSGG